MTGTPQLVSYVVRRRTVTKNDVIAWAEDHGFSTPEKKPGQPGLYKRQREDLADAFVLRTMAEEAHAHLLAQTGPRKGDIFLDPDKGLCTRPDLILNRGSDT